MQLQNMLKYRMGWLSGSGPESEAILSCRVRLARNFSQIPFPNRADSRTLESIREQTFKSAQQAKSLAKAAYLKLEELEPVDRNFLMERHLISQDLAGAQKNGSGGLAVGERELLSLMVNEEDHIRIQGIGPGLCLKEVWSKVSSLDTELGKLLPYAYDPVLGYLTACPTNVGTGLRTSALVHLPALTLTGHIHRALENLSRLGMTARGLYGEGTRAIGDFFQISNATALGHSEEVFAENIEKVVKSLVDREMEHRRKLATGAARVKAEDTVYRALGILTHVRSISFEEAIMHLSRVRMGLTVGMEIPSSLETLNELMILCRPSHIQMAAQKELGPEDRDVFRADLIRKRL